MLFCVTWVKCIFFLLSPSSSCVSTGSTWPVRFCYALCVLAKGLFHLWQVRLLSWQANPPQNPPLHVGMSEALSRHSLCVWIDRSVCHVGMLRAVCLVGQWKLVTPYCGSRDYPWKEPGCPPLSFLFSNSLTLILLSSSVLPSAWTRAVTFAQMWGGRRSCPLIMLSAWPQSKGFHFVKPSQLNFIIRWFVQSNITCILFNTILHCVL